MTKQEPAAEARWSKVSALLAEGENSGVEFKRDDIRPEMLAKELVALSNLRGGRLLLGVEDDGRITGVTRDNIEEWVMTVAGDKVRPPLIPYFELVTDQESGRRVAVVEVEQGYAVHAVWHNQHYSYQVRVGSVSREASPEELARLQQQCGAFRAELRPVSGARYEDLDHRRLRDYFGRVRGQDIPDQRDVDAWTGLLVATEFLVDGVTGPVPSLAAMLLFGRSVARHLPHAAIDAVAYPGPEKDYAAIERATLRAALSPLADAVGEIVEPGLVDLAAFFVRRNVGVRSTLVDGTRRVETPGLPTEPVREALVNAVIHRDYMLMHTDVELSLYSDRLEVVSPGRLPNGVTVEGMLAGTRAARNEIVKDVMRDYGYLEHMGLGVPRKIVRGMREFNGTTPGLSAETERVSVRLAR